MITLLFNTLATCKLLTFAPLLIHTRILGYLIRNMGARQNPSYESPPAAEGITLPWRRWLLQVPLRAPAQQPPVAGLGLISWLLIL